MLRVSVVLWGFLDRRVLTSLAPDWQLPITNGPRCVGPGQVAGETVYQAAAKFDISGLVHPTGLASPTFVVDWDLIRKGGPVVELVDGTTRVVPLPPCATVFGSMECYP